MNQVLPSPGALEARGWEDPQPNQETWSPGAPPIVHDSAWDEGLGLEQPNLGTAADFNAPEAWAKSLDTFLHRLNTVSAVVKEIPMQAKTIRSQNKMRMNELFSLAETAYFVSNTTEKTNAYIKSMSIGTSTDHAIPRRGLR
jgi:hypothetical protein